MRKLELKDIKSYIDTDLICKCDKWEQPQVLTGMKSNGILFFGEIGTADLCVNEIKPYLYSMDWLTKEISHKGETFVPIVKLFEHLTGLYVSSESEIEFEYDFDIDGADNYEYQYSIMVFDDIKLEINHKAVPCLFSYNNERLMWDCDFIAVSQEYFDKLSEWQFDFRGLLDAGLAIPVTNEFNPYK